MRQARAKPRIEFVEVVHGERHAAAGEVEHHMLDRRAAVRGLEADASSLPLPGMRMSVARYWSPKAWRPMTIGWVQPGTRRGTFLQMMGWRKTVPSRMLRIVPFGRLPHLLEVEFLHPRLVGRDGGAFDADAMLLDRIGGVDGDLVVGRVAALDAEIEIDEIDDRDRGGSSFSLMKCQMMRVISSPSSSTIGLATLIFFMSFLVPVRGGGS